MPSLLCDDMNKIDFLFYTQVRQLEKLLRADPFFGEIVKELETCSPLKETQIGVKSTS